MEEQSIDGALLQRIRRAQRDEAFGAALYGFMAHREKNESNARILLQMSKDEVKHAEMWHAITHESIAPSKLKLMWMKMLTVVLGFTFVVKTLQRGEQFAQGFYQKLQQDMPQAASMLDDEERHEQELQDMLDEERLHYVGAMVLGLDDALVELTGAIAGMTFALANNRLVALSAIIIGVSATLSMMASNYLAERANGNGDAMKSSAYVGVAYIVTVALLVMPYLVFPENMFLPAFVVMILLAIFIIFAFNYYISVAKDEPFMHRFVEMTLISLAVAVISFAIALLAKQCLGVDTM